MQATPSTLFTAEQKERLTAAVRLRTSVRSFEGEITPQQLAALAYHAGRWTLPGVRVTLRPVEETTFSAATTTTGCRMVFQIAVREDNWRHRMHAGIVGEALALEATAMGLGSCWLDYALPTDAPGETSLCVIAVGPPAEPLTAPASRRRMAPENFCRGDWQKWPEQLLRAAALVQQAPSAQNQQPWTLFVAPSGAFAVDTPLKNALDAGIALCHAELALTTPHHWQYGSRYGEPLAVAVVDK